MEWGDGAFILSMPSDHFINCTEKLLRNLAQYNHSASLNNESTQLYNQTLLDWESVRMLCDKEQLRVGAQASSLGVVILSSLLANILVLVVFFQRPSLLTISNRFVLNLAVSNLLITLLVMPFAFASTLLGQSWEVNNVGCNIISTATTTLFANCIYTLLLISVDRLYAIKRPLHYSMKITRFRSVFYIFVVWGASILVALPPVFITYGVKYQPSKGLCGTNWQLNTAIMKVYAFGFITACFVLPFLTMFWIYVTIFRAVQKTSAMARRNSVTPDSNDISATQRMLSPPPPMPNRRRSSVISLALMQISTVARRQSSNASRISFHREDWRAAKTGIIVMFTFTLCWFPIFMVVALEASLPPSSHLPSSLQGVSVWLSFLVCALNPMVYVFRTRAFKQELFALLGRKSADHNGRILIKEPPDTPSCQITKTSSAATFTRMLTPRPSGISASDIVESYGPSSNLAVNLKALVVHERTESPDFVSTVRASVDL